MNQETKPSAGVARAETTRLAGTFMARSLVTMLVVGPGNDAVDSR